MQTLGDRLQRLRNEKRLTQEELATQFKISKSAVGMYERNEREPSLELLKQLASFFGVSLGYLVGEDRTTEDNDGINPDLAEALKRITPEQQDRVRKFLRGEVDTPIQYSDGAKSFMRDIQQGVSLEELSKHYKPTIAGREATQEEIEEAIRYIKAKRIMDMM